MADRPSDNPPPDPGKAGATLQRAMIAVVRDASEAGGRAAEDAFEAAGLSAQAVARIEAGERDLRFKEVVALCRAVGARPSEITARAERLLAERLGS
jgi:DNA-binding Xre family transcriptional regulator